MHRICPVDTAGAVFGEMPAAIGANSPSSTKYFIVR